MFRPNDNSVLFNFADFYKLVVETRLLDSLSRPRKLYYTRRKM
jgi:hypothetical protein